MEILGHVKERTLRSAPTAADAVPLGERGAAIQACARLLYGIFFDSMSKKESISLLGSEP